MTPDLDAMIHQLYEMVGELKGAEMLNVVEKTLMGRCVNSMKHSKNRLNDLRQFLKAGILPANYKPKGP